MNDLNNEETVIQMLGLLYDKYKLSGEDNDSSIVNITGKQAKYLLDAIEVLIKQRNEAHLNPENLSISFRYESDDAVLKILMQAM